MGCTNLGVCWTRKDRKFLSATPLHRWRDEQLLSSWKRVNFRRRGSASCRQSSPLLAPRPHGVRSKRLVLDWQWLQCLWCMADRMRLSCWAIRWQRVRRRLRLRLGPERGAGILRKWLLYENAPQSKVVLSRSVWRGPDWAFCIAHQNLLHRQYGSLDWGLCQEAHYHGWDGFSLAGLVGLGWLQKNWNGLDKTDSLWQMAN